MSLRMRTLIGLAGLTALAIPTYAQSVSAGYVTDPDPNLDHMILTIANNTAVSFDALTLTESLPADPTVAGSVPVVDSLSFGSLAPNTTLTLSDPSQFPLSFGNNPATFITSPFDVTVSALLAGQPFATTFNQDHNATGGFVEFEGIGEGSTPPYQTVPLTRVGTLAAVPEPGTLALLCAGLVLTAGAVRRRRTAC